MAKMKKPIPAKAKPAPKAKSVVQLTIDDLLAKVNKECGPNTLVRASTAKGLRIKKIPFGIAALDLTLLGGIPMGRITELRGKMSTGKTTAAYHLVGNFLNMYNDGIVVWISVEREFDTEWMEYNGVNLDRVLLGLPDSGEQTSDAAYKILNLANEREVHLLVVVDSIASMPLTAQLDEKSSSQSHMGKFAQFVGNFCKKLVAASKKCILDPDPRITVLFLNHLRDKVGVAFGDPFFAPGGNGRDSFASMMISFIPGKKLKLVLGGKDTVILKEAVGQETHFKVDKNKCHGAREATGSFTFFNRGYKLYEGGSYDNADQVVNRALVLELIKPEANGTKVHLVTPIGTVTSKAALIKHLVENPEDYEKMYSVVLEELRRRFWSKNDVTAGSGKNVVEESEEDDDDE